MCIRGVLGRLTSGLSNAAREEVAGGGGTPHLRSTDACSRKAAVSARCQAAKRPAEMGFTEKDLDDFFSYDTVRYVRVKDYRLGIPNMIITVGIVIKIFIITLIMGGGYL